ncbi:hypothetical protein [Lentzea flava]|nr:hypothetical protein [Lentzea flava]MCP2199847.1 hypothetical protein [Lentzea flava]
MSEQGQAPGPPEPPKDHPQAARPAPEQTTTPLPADASATPGPQQPAAPGPQPTAEQPVQPGPQATAEQSAAAASQPTGAQAAATGPQATTEQPAATAAEAPAAPHAAAPIPPPAPPAAPGRFRRFAGHRATQLVAAGLLGLVLGGGIVGAIAANRVDHRGPGHVRVHDRGDRGPDRFEQRGPFSDHGDRGDRFER